MSGEAIADIVAEMRDFAEHRDYDSDGNMSTTLMRVFADRIEAAAKREKAQLGNAAAMREALEKCRETLIGWQTCTISRTEHRDTIAAVNAALAAPARNCDMGTPDEQGKRFDSFCRHPTHGTCRNCPAGKLKQAGVSTCLILWAQMPYEEAERK